MTLHWTYNKFCPESGLEQGDLIEPTPQIKKVLQEIHPHFCDEKYLGFIVTTQSCDLVVRKKGLPKADYISIASVRPLRQVMSKLLAIECREIIPGVYGKNTKKNAQQLVERLLNQNEQKIGLFYLHEDPSINWEAGVAFLRISIALRANEHYEKLKSARKGRLSPEFQSKLGWLVGNLYSRPACPDWREIAGESQFKKLCKTFLEQNSDGAPPYWLDEGLLAEAKNKNVNITDAQSVDELEAMLKQCQPKPKIESAIEIIKQKLKLALLNGRDTCPNDDKLVDPITITSITEVEAFVDKFGNRLKNSPIRTLF